MRLHLLLGDSTAEVDVRRDGEEIVLDRAAVLAATAAVQEALARLRQDGTPHDDGALSFSGFTDLIGLAEMQRLEARFAAAPGS